jgi:hypothetical protein
LHNNLSGLEDTIKQDCKEGMALLSGHNEEIEPTLLGEYFSANEEDEVKDNNDFLARIEAEVEAKIEAEVAAWKAACAARLLKQI